MSHLDSSLQLVAGQALFVAKERKGEGSRKNFFDTGKYFKENGLSVVFLEFALSNHGY